MKKIKLYVPILFALGVFTFSACSDDSDDPEPVAKTTYSTDISPILNKSCNFSGCHNIGSANGSIANYADAKTFAEGGRILGALKHEDGYSEMPKNGNKLSDANIASVEKWIADGLPE